MATYHDELRIMHELQTFTAEDLQSAMECPLGTAQSILSVLTGRGMVERVKVRRTFVYALTEKGKRRVARLPVIDAGEMCLMLVRVFDNTYETPINPCPNCGVPHDWQAGGSVDFVHGTISFRCIGCGDWRTYVDCNDDIPF